MSNITRVIDQLGIVKAQIADLKEKEEALKAVLIASGDGAYEGHQFRATVSTFERSTLDVDACRAKLSPQFISAHTTTKEVVVVKVSARNNVGVKIAA